MYFMRLLGFGDFKAGKTNRIWAQDFIDWLDRFTIYRTKNEIVGSFQKTGFIINYIEEEHIAFRLSRLGLGSFIFLMGIPFLRGSTRLICCLLGGLVILSTRMS
jgi:hypothetical protein